MEWPPLTCRTFAFAPPVSTQSLRTEFHTENGEFHAENDGFTLEMMGFRNKNCLSH